MDLWFRIAMMNGYQLIFLIFSLLSFLTLDPRVARALSEEAEVYLQQVLELIRVNSADMSIHRTKWPQLKAHALKMAEKAQTSRDTYPAIRFVLKELGNNYGMLIEPDQISPLSRARGRKDITRPYGWWIAGHVAFLAVPGFIGHAWETKHYTQRLQALVKRLRNKQPIGWIIDLRDNRGGDLFLLQEGLAPLLSQHPLFNRHSLLNQNTQVNQQLLLSQQQLLHQQPLPEKDKALITQPFIAILVGPQTAGAAEAFALAMKGRQKTRLFGEKTTGLALFNRCMMLPDRAVLCLAGAIPHRAKANHYKGQLIPDVQVTSAYNAKHDPALQKALDWMLDELENLSVE
jgi:hypothetical protein